MSCLRMVDAKLAEMVSGSLVLLTRGRYPRFAINKQLFCCLLKCIIVQYENDVGTVVDLPKLSVQLERFSGLIWER